MIRISEPIAAVYSALARRPGGVGAARQRRRPSPIPKVVGAPRPADREPACRAGPPAVAVLGLGRRKRSSASWSSAKKLLGPLPPVAASLDRPRRGPRPGGHRGFGEERPGSTRPFRAGRRGTVAQPGAERAPARCGCRARSRPSPRETCGSTILRRSKDPVPCSHISHEAPHPSRSDFSRVGGHHPRAPGPRKAATSSRGMFDQSRRRLLLILDDALLLTQIDVNSREQFRSAPVPLHAALSHAIERTTELSPESLSCHAHPAIGEPVDLVLGDEAVAGTERFTLSGFLGRQRLRGGQAVRITREVAVRFREGCHREPWWRTIPSAALEKFFELSLDSRRRAHQAGNPARSLPWHTVSSSSRSGASVSVLNESPFWNTTGHIAQGCCAGPLT